MFAAQEALIRRHAPGRSFADIGCLWGVDGACAFLAEAAGASPVTAMDKWEATDEFTERHARAGSSVRFVQADLHDLSMPDEVGEHDVVWCSGVLYHTPNPVQAVGQLLRLTRELLIVGTKSLPEIPGLPGVAVHYPGLSPEARRVYEPIARPVATEPYDRNRYFANWFWGLSPEALMAIARSLQDVELIERVDLPWNRRHDDVYVVLRKTGR